MTLEYINILKPKYLTEEFLSPYLLKDAPFGSDFGLVVYLRTYSRYIPQLKRRERWFETVARVVEYSLSLYNGDASFRNLQKEAEELYDYMFNMKVFPSGRTMWVGGIEGVDGIAQFNCSYRNIDSIEAFSEIFYLLLVGCGTGYSVEKKYVSQLPQFNQNVSIFHDEYIPLDKDSRIENTQIYIKDRDKSLCRNLNDDFLVDEKTTLILDLINKTEGAIDAEIDIGDSKTGWCTALKAFLHLLTYPQIKTIRFDYCSVRPAGEPIKGFGGRASGPGALQKLLEKIEWIIKNTPFGTLRSTDAMDICNVIAEGVVSGGVRRSSELSLGDPDDISFIESKLNLWSGPNLKDSQLTKLIKFLEIAGYKLDLDKLKQEQQKLLEEKPWLDSTPLDLIFNQFSQGSHEFLWSNKENVRAIALFVDSVDPKYRYRSSRVMSNNSVHVFSKPRRKELGDIFKRIQTNGEPAFFIGENATKRRPRYRGSNPCAN